MTNDNSTTPHPCSEAPQWRRWAAVGRVDDHWPASDLRSYPVDYNYKLRSCIARVQCCNTQCAPETTKTKQDSVPRWLPDTPPAPLPTAPPSCRGQKVTLQCPLSVSRTAGKATFCHLQNIDSLKSRSLAGRRINNSRPPHHGIRSQGVAVLWRKNGSLCQLSSRRLEDT